MIPYEDHEWSLYPFLVYYIGILDLRLSSGLVHFLKNLTISKFQSWTYESKKKLNQLNDH